MAKIGSLTVDLTLKSAEFIRDLGKSSQAVARNTEVMRRSVNALAAGFTGLLSARLIKQIAGVTEESLKLAASMSGPLSDSATKFLSQFEELQHAFQVGVATGFLEDFNKEVLNTPENLKKAGEAGTTFGKIMKAVADDVGQFFGTDLPNFIDDVKKKYGELKNAAQEWRIEVGAASDHVKNVFAPPPPTDEILAYGTAAELAALQTEQFWSAQVTATAHGEELLRTLDEQNKIMLSLRTPAEDYAAALDRIAMANLTGADAARAHSAATAALVGNYLQLADNIGTALGTLFKESKGVAIAQAVINTAQAITKTFAEYGATPWGFALAASMAAIGAAQIAAIASSNPGSSKATKKASGGGASSATSRAGAASRGGGSSFTQAVTIEILGDVFGPEHFRKMVAGINGVQRDGTALLRVA